MSEQNTSTEAPQQVECSAAFDPILRKGVMMVMALGFGLLCAYDAWFSGKYDAPEQAATWWFNAICAVVLIPVGIVLAVLFFRALGTKLVANAEGIGYAGSNTVAWDKISKIVIRGKGLMDLRYECDGENGVLELDSWKLKNFDELVRLVESKTEGVPVENVGK